MPVPVVIQQHMFNTLAGYAGVANLVGSRVYPDNADQGVAKPYLVWQEVSLLKVGNDLGGSVESSGLDNYRIQVTAWANGIKGASDARALDYQVRLAMIAATAFKSLHIDSRALPFEPETKMYGFQSDFSVWLNT